MDDIERIKILRKAKGLTQKELADKLDVTKQYISQIESRQNKTSRKIKSKISKAFALPHNFWEGEITIHEGNFNNNRIGEIILTPKSLSALDSFIQEINKCNGAIQTKPVNPEYNLLSDKDKTTIDNIIHVLLMQEKGREDD